MKAKILFFTIITISLVSLQANGQVLRDFSASTLKNETVSYNDLKGEAITVFDFWASWCRPCLKAMPKLEKIYQEYKSKGVNVVGVNTDGPRSIAKALPLINSLKITYPNISDIEGNVKEDLEVGSLPTLLVIKNNKVVYRHEGFAHGDEEEWRKTIDKLLEK